MAVLAPRQPLTERSATDLARTIRHVAVAVVLKLERAFGDWVPPTDSSQAGGKP